MDEASDKTDIVPLLRIQFVDHPCELCCTAGKPQEWIHRRVMAAMDMAEEGVLRILCLHGSNQCSAVFAKR